MNRSFSVVPSVSLRGHCTRGGLLTLVLAMSSCDSSSGSVDLETGSATRRLSSTAPISDDHLDTKQALAEVRASLWIEDAQGERKRDLRGLFEHLVTRQVRTRDPYYKTQKSFLAVSLSSLLKSLWPDLPQAGEQFEIEASDGYKVLVSSEQAFNPAAYLAFKDVDFPPFQAIGPQRANPAPLYLIWEGEQFTDLQSHPRPWAIARLRRLSSGDGASRLVPRDGWKQNSSAESGFSIFNQECVRCHSINQQGGKVGPDLNVPQNILEYRPENQVRSYIKDPGIFRYSAMPAHPHLSDKDIDNLLAYFKVMASSKQDPKEATR